MKLFVTKNQWIDIWVQARNFSPQISVRGLRGHSRQTTSGRQSYCYKASWRRATFPHKWLLYRFLLHVLDDSFTQSKFPWLQPWPILWLAVFIVVWLFTIYRTEIVKRGVWPRPIVRAVWSPSYFRKLTKLTHNCHSQLTPCANAAPCRPGRMERSILQCLLMPRWCKASFTHALRCAARRVTVRGER